MTLKLSKVALRETNLKTDNMVLRCGTNSTPTPWDGMNFFQSIL